MGRGVNGHIRRTGARSLADFQRNGRGNPGWIGALGLVGMSKNIKAPSIICHRALSTGQCQESCCFLENQASLFWRMHGFVTIVLKISYRDGKREASQLYNQYLTGREKRSKREVCALCYYVRMLKYQLYDHRSAIKVTSSKKMIATHDYRVKTNKSRLFLFE